MKKVEVPLWAKPGSLVWLEIRDKTGQEVLEYLEAQVTVADFDKQILKVKKKDSDSEFDQNPEFVFERLEDHKLVSDLAAIPLLNDAELLRHLEVRYKQDYIHCFCGPTLVVINPYKRVDHEESQETWDTIHRHLKDNTLVDCIPHLWTISAKCWDGLFKTGLNQAICISGESGAGKTESTKRCMAFLTKMNSSRQSIGTVPIEDKILACNPLLEAFGNAKTFRNDNSSRFGKYTVLYIDKDRKKVKGASIENYLLEKSRCVVLGKEERNYHVFYCLCRFGSPDMMKKYKMLNNNGKCDMSKFNFLNGSGVYTVGKINDEEFMNDIQTSLKNLDFSADETDAIWRNIATILWLGNIEVDTSEYVEGQKACKIKKTEAWRNVLELLEIDEGLFEMALTNKEIKVGASVTRSPLSPGQCKNSMDSIAKEIYNRMFSWIVLKLNQTLIPDGDLKSYGTIGILDIFGFEIFDKNSLEQFFINFANERLQSLYIEYIFKNECRIFEEEGLAEYTQLIVYTDNKNIVNCLEFAKQPPGIFNLIDGACAMNKSDDKLHADIISQHGKNPVLIFPKFAKQMSFTVKHTARDVEYLTDNFVEKNKDELSPFLKQAFDTSNATVVAIFDMTSGIKNLGQAEANQQVNPKEKFLGFKFRRDMSNLVGQLIACQCQFIRCIKPNEEKKKDYWNAHLALLQIQYMGMLDSLKVRKQSYPNRFTFAQFFELYQDLDMGENGAKNFRGLQDAGANFKDLCKGIFQYVDNKPTDKDVLYGKGRIFLQEDYKIKLDKLLLIKQKKKREAIKCIAELYKTYEKKMWVKGFFVTQSKSIMISRDLLKSFTAKLDGLKFKGYVKLIRTLQFKFRFVKEKRLKRYQSHNMTMILRYLGMYKFSQILKYILYYKRKVQIVQAMLDAKIRDAKNRHCRAIVENLFQGAWKKISSEIVGNSAKDVQRTFRAYVLRQKKAKEYSVLEKRIEERQEYNSSANVQKFIRGYLVRSRMERLNQAASKIQGFLRTKWMRSYFLQVIHAVKVLQKWFRKMYIRILQVREKMDPFMQENGSYNDNVARLEDRILFGNQQELADLENMNDYAKLPFYQKEREIRFGSKNYQKFIPATPEIEIQPKVKLVSLLVDIDVFVDTTNAYDKTWAKEFLDFLQDVHKRGKRFLQLEIGDSFSMGVTDDREVHSWGLNDFKQCAKDSGSFISSVSQVKNLSANNVKQLSLGKDHGLMVDEGSNVYVWGNNHDGQLGLGHTRRVNSLMVMDSFKEEIVSALAKENKNYVLTSTGKVFEWPVKQDEEMVYKPTRVVLPKTEIGAISAGVDFLMMLTTNGILFAKGSNEYGELGLGDNQPRHKPERVEYFLHQNEKVLEVSAGYKHSICRTALKHIFTWGNNNNGQLGHGDLVWRSVPEQIHIQNQKGQRLAPRSVQAGLHCCFILISDKNLYFTGKIGSKPKIATQPHKFDYDQKFHANRVSDNFGPVKICTKWSSMMTTTYMIFADFRNTKISALNRENFIGQLNGEWTSNADQVLPTGSLLLQKYMDSKYLLSTSKKLNQVNFKFSNQYVAPVSQTKILPQKTVEANKSIVLEKVQQNPIQTSINKNPSQLLKQSEGIDQSKETALPFSKAPLNKTPLKNAPSKPLLNKTKTPLKKAPVKTNQMQGDLQKKIEMLKKKDPSELNAQEQQILKMYSKMFS